jgi:hypothetical protein
LGTDESSATAAVVAAVVGVAAACFFSQATSGSQRSAHRMTWFIFMER